MLSFKAKVGDFGLAREGAEYKMEMEDELGDQRKVTYTKIKLLLSIL